MLPLWKHDNFFFKLLQALEIVTGPKKKSSCKRLIARKVVPEPRGDISIAGEWGSEAVRPWGCVVTLSERHTRQMTCQLWKWTLNAASVASGAIIQLAGGTSTSRKPHCCRLDAGNNSKCNTGTIYCVKDCIMTGWLIKQT